MEFKVTLQEQVCYRGTIWYWKLQSVTQLDTMVKSTMTKTVWRSITWAIKLSNMRGKARTRCLSAIKRHSRHSFSLKYRIIHWPGPSPRLSYENSEEGGRPPQPPPRWMRLECVCVCVYLVCFCKRLAYLKVAKILVCSETTAYDISSKCCDLQAWKFGRIRLIRGRIDWHIFLTHLLIVLQHGFHIALWNTAVVNYDVSAMVIVFARSWILN